MSPWHLSQKDAEVLAEVDVVGVDVEVSFSLQLCQTLPNLPLRLQTSEPLPSCLLPRMGRQVLKGDIEFAILWIGAKLGESCAPTKRLVIKNISEISILNSEFVQPISKTFSSCNV